MAAFCTYCTGGDFRGRSQLQYLKRYAGWASAILKSFAKIKQVRILVSGYQDNTHVGWNILPDTLDEMERPTRQLIHNEDRPAPDLQKPWNSRPYLEIGRKWSVTSMPLVVRIGKISSSMRVIAMGGRTEKKLPKIPLDFNQKYLRLLSKAHCASVVSPLRQRPSPPTVIGGPEELLERHLRPCAQGLHPGDLHSSPPKELH